jgi:hypothetical protein
VPLPFQQADLADGLGLSLVHTNKTLSRLCAEKVAHWTRFVLNVLGRKWLAEIAMTEPDAEQKRPILQASPCPQPPWDPDQQAVGGGLPTPWRCKRIREPGTGLPTFPCICNTVEMRMPWTIHSTSTLMSAKYQALS